MQIPSELADIERLLIAVLRTARYANLGCERFYEREPLKYVAKGTGLLDGSEGDLILAASKSTNLLKGDKEMPVDMFCKVDSIKGESTDDKHKDQIEVLSFNHGLHQPVSSTASSAGGAATGRSEHDDFTIAKHIDAATPKLLEACAKGQHLKDVTIEFCRAGGDKLTFMEIKMEQVMISHVVPSGYAKGDDDLPTESVSFNYGSIKWTYTQQKRKDGSGGGKITGGWDRTANKVAA